MRCQFYVTHTACLCGSRTVNQDMCNSRWKLQPFNSYQERTYFVYILFHENSKKKIFSNPIFRKQSSWKCWIYLKCCVWIWLWDCCWLLIKMLHVEHSFFCLVMLKCLKWCWLTNIYWEFCATLCAVSSTSLCANVKASIKYQHVSSDDKTLNPE